MERRFQMSSWTGLSKSSTRVVEFCTTISNISFQRAGGGMILNHIDFSREAVPIFFGGKIELCVVGSIQWPQTEETDPLRRIHKNNRGFCKSFRLGDDFSAPFRRTDENQKVEIISIIQTVRLGDDFCVPMYIYVAYWIDKTFSKGFFFRCRLLDRKKSFPKGFVSGLKKDRSRRGPYSCPSNFAGFDVSGIPSWPIKKTTARKRKIENIKKKAKHTHTYTHTHTDDVRPFRTAPTTTSGEYQIPNKKKEKEWGTDEQRLHGRRCNTSNGRSGWRHPTMF